MPIHFLASVISRSLSWDAYGPVAATLVSIVCLKRWAAGVTLSDKIEDAMDMHGRVFLVTGGLSTFGVTVLSNLCNRGAHVVILIPPSEMVADQTLQLIQLLRDSTRNASIYAEGCDILYPDSVAQFCKKWNEGAPLTPGSKPSPRRLDGIVFLPLDALHGTSKPQTYEERAFLEVAGRTLLLSEILPDVIKTTPPERPVRIISTISPWYAAGVDVLQRRLYVRRNNTSSKQIGSSHRLARSVERFRADGAASLHWLILTTAWQRRLDTAASQDMRPRHSLLGKLGKDVTARDDLAMPRRSNINVVNVCVGFERNRDVLGYILPPTTPNLVEKQSRTRTGGFDVTAMIFARYLLAAILYPLIWLLSRSPGASCDGAVWAVVAPLEKQKSAAVPVIPSGLSDQEQSVRRLPGDGLIPGELYRDGRIIAAPLPASVAELSDGSTQIPSLVSIPFSQLDALLQVEEEGAKAKITKRE